MTQQKKGIRFLIGTGLLTLALLGALGYGYGYGYGRLLPAQQQAAISHFSHAS